MIKRTCNFYWVNSKSSPTQFTGNFFFALYSFLIHHPHWETRLWTNNVFTGEWFQRCIDKGLIVKMMDLRDYPYPMHKNPSFIVDYYKCKTLAEEGGLICDLNDSITIACHDDVWDKADKLMWANYCGGNTGGIMSGGWMLKNSPSKLMQELIKQPVQNNEGKHYELIAPDLIPKYVDDCFQEPSEHKIMFPMLNWQVQAALTSGDWKQFMTPDTRQTHWFFGNIYQSSYHDTNRKYIMFESDLKDWWTKTGAYVDCFKYSLSMAKDNLLNEIETMQKNKKPTERIAHFTLMDVEDGKRVNLKGWMVMGIKSFMFHNPGWKINLWTNCTLSSLNQLSSCFDNGLTIKPFNVNSKVPHYNIRNIEALNDYVRIWAVYSFGGMGIGLDTITTGCFNSIYDMSEKFEWTWYGHQPEKYDRFLLSWFSCKNPGNEFLKMVLNMSPVTPNGIPIYGKLMKTFYKEFFDYVSEWPIEWQIITPTYSQWIPTVLYSKSIKSSLNNVMKMYHWYYEDYEDDTMWKIEKQKIIDEESEMNEGWENRNSAYIQLYQYSIKTKESN